MLFFKSDSWLQREGDHLEFFDDDDNVLDLASLG